MTGFVSLERALERERLVQSAAELLRTEPDELLAAIGRLAERQREAEKELARLRQQSSEAEAKTLAEAAAADGGVVVARRDKVDAGRPAQTWPRPSCATTACGPSCSAGSPDGAKAAIVAATGRHARRHPARADARARWSAAAVAARPSGDGGGQGSFPD